MIVNVCLFYTLFIPRGEVGWIHYMTKLDKNTEQQPIYIYNILMQE